MTKMLVGGVIALAGVLVGAAIVFDKQDKALEE